MQPLSKKKTKQRGESVGHGLTVVIKRDDQMARITLSPSCVSNRDEVRMTSIALAKALQPRDTKMPPLDRSVLGRLRDEWVEASKPADLKVFLKDLVRSKGSQQIQELTPARLHKNIINSLDCE